MSHIRVIFILIALAFFSKSYGQLVDFTLILSKTNETCKANGTISFISEGTVKGATVVYSIFKLPEINTPFAVISTNRISGLGNGVYRVVATQSLLNLSNRQQKDITIENKITPLTYSILSENAICNNDGKISIAIISGIPISYEIISGPEVRPKQTSPIFNNVKPGKYNVRVIDACGEGVVQTATIIKKESNLDINQETTKKIINCNTLEINQIIHQNPQNTIPFPLTLEYTIFPPSGNSILLHKTISSGGTGDLILSQKIPFYNNQHYSYDLVINDNCGNKYIFNSNLINISLYPIIKYLPQQNGYFTITITNTIQVNITEAPIAYQAAIPADLSSLIDTKSGIFILKDVPYGDYKFIINDICNVKHGMDLAIPKKDNLPIQYTVKEGCSTGMGSIKIDSDSILFNKANIIKSPKEFSVQLPININQFITSNKENILLNNLPKGNYTLEIEDAKGIKQNLNFTIEGFLHKTNINIKKNCGVYDLELVHTSNILPAASPTFWIQKYNETTGQWEHPITGEKYVNDAITKLNALSITIGENVNFFFYGKFRIIENFLSYRFSNDTNITESCFQVLKEYKVQKIPDVTAVYAFSCSEGKNDVIIQTAGTLPMQYSITSKDGLPFQVDNGNNNLFTGLSAGLYNFRIEDSCGNILNYIFDITHSILFNITPTSFCENTSNDLSVPYFPFLTYKWWKKSDPSKIIGTSNVLNFPDFQSLKDGGIYQLNVVYDGNETSCINFVVEYNVLSSNVAPNAGSDITKLICDASTTIDLNTLLERNVTKNGIWIEETESNSLQNGKWNPINLAFGNYVFKYIVTGNCDSYDEAIVTLLLKQSPKIIDLATQPLICANTYIYLYATVFPQEVSYHWQGPKNFTSSIQNPIIEPNLQPQSGIYSLYIDNEGCLSETSNIEINIQESPEFTLNGDCYDNQYFVKTTFKNKLQTENENNFSWTGPNAFTSMDQKINLTGLPNGNYNLLVTNKNGCTAEQGIWIQSTFCEFQRGISRNGDFLNQSFDLSAFENIEKLRIYNRYGVLVYEQKHYKNEWSGQDNHGNILPDGTFYYEVSFSDRAPKTGWIYLAKN